MVTIEEFDNRKEWRLNGTPHREDGPAKEWNNGYKEWWKNGLLHRDDGPAIKWYNGDEEWWKNGLKHRDDGPAGVYVGANKSWYQHGKRHRLDGPAVECRDGTKMWYQHGKRHRDDGPAQEWYDGKKYWYLYDWCLTVELIKAHQINRIQSISMALSPLELPPYIILWIFEWSESAYLNQLNVRSVVKMLEGIRDSREKIKSNGGNQ